MIYYFNGFNNVKAIVINKTETQDNPLNADFVEEVRTVAKKYQKSSEVWAYFTILQGGKKAKCLNCKTNENFSVRQ